MVFSSRGFSAREIQEIKEETLRIFRGERGQIEGLQIAGSEE